MVIKSFQMPIGNSHWEIEVPSRVDGKRRNLARVSDFVSWDEACRVQDSSSFHPRVIEPVSPTMKRRNLHALP